RVVADLDVAGERSVVGENGPRPDLAVVRDVDVGHQAVVVADPCHAATAYRPAVNRRELAKAVACAHAQLRLLAAQRQLPGRPRAFDRRSRAETISTSSLNWSPGTTGRRNLHASIPVKYGTLSSRPSSETRRQTAAVCAIASTTRTPGITGLPGKCPWKNSSL